MILVTGLFCSTTLVELNWSDSGGVETTVQHSGIASYSSTDQHITCTDFLCNWRCIHLPWSKSVWGGLQWHQHFGSKYAHDSNSILSTYLLFFFKLFECNWLFLRIGGEGEASSVYVRFSTVVPNEITAKEEIILAGYEYDVRLSAACSLWFGMQCY